MPTSLLHQGIYYSACHDPTICPWSIWEKNKSLGTGCSDACVICPMVASCARHSEKRPQYDKFMTRRHQHRWAEPSTRVRKKQDHHVHVRHQYSQIYVRPTLYHEYSRHCITLLSFSQVILDFDELGHLLTLWGVTRHIYPNHRCQVWQVYSSKQGHKQGIGQQIATKWFMGKTTT